MTRRLRPLLGLVAIAGVCLVAPPAASGSVTPSEVAELLGQADHVFIGLVREVRPGWNATRTSIDTTVRIVVEEYFKSSTFPPHFTLVLPGGTVDDVTLKVEGVPTFSVGDRTLLFLKEDPGRPGPRIVGAWQGVYFVRNGTAVQAESGRRVPLADLKARLRSEIRVPPPAYGGAIMRRRSTEELALQAASVVIGFVDRVESRLTPDGTSIESEVTVQLERTLKGTMPATFSLILPGGRVGDLQLQVGGVPNFWPGERVLLFLSQSGPWLGVAGLWQGKFTLVRDQAMQPETGRTVSTASLTARIANALANPSTIREPDGPAVVEAPFTTFCLPWAASQVPVAHFVNGAGPGPGAPGGIAFVKLVQQALQAWQDVSSAWISARIAGTTVRTATNHFDGLNDVAWANLDVLDPNVLGVNFCVTQAGARLDSDTQFDTTGVLWSTTALLGTIDLDSVARHEFGHGLGLGHTGVVCDGGPITPLMCPSIAAGVEKTLRADDISGITALYPLSGGPPAAPTALTAGASSCTSFQLTWTPVANALAYEIQRASGAGAFQAVNSVPASTSTYLDDDLGPGLPSGTYSYRVKALGRGGDSGFSNIAQPGGPASPYDFDGMADIAVFRRSSGQWLVRRSAGILACVMWGAPGLDTPVVADYDGDGQGDIAVFRRSTGQWFILNSSGGFSIVPWGGFLSDTPVPADYDGDGKANVAIFRTTTAQWYVLGPTGGFSVVVWGGVGIDTPVPADYDGDGKADIAVFRSGAGAWYILESTGGFSVVQWGGANMDIPVAADYDGDGKADIAVFRPGTGAWYILNSTSGFSVVQWGGAGGIDTPVPADYDGDGKADIAVFRPSTAQWFVLNSAGGISIVPWGAPTATLLGDTPALLKP